MCVCVCVCEVDFANESDSRLDVELMSGNFILNLPNHKHQSRLCEDGKCENVKTVLNRNHYLCRRTLIGGVRNFIHILFTPGEK